MGYQKQNFDAGQLLTASELNHIEDGFDLYLPLTGGMLTGGITLPNYVAYKGLDSNGNAKSLIHINTSDNVVVNGQNTGTTYIQGNAIHFGAPLDGNIVIPNSTASYRALDTNGDAQTLIYLTVANSIKIGASFNTNVNNVLIENDVHCNGGLQTQGAINANNGALIANNCTSPTGGVSGGYLSISGRCCLVGADSSSYPQVLFVANKGNTFVRLQSNNTSAVSYTLTLPNANGTIAVSSSDIRLKENVKTSNVDALSILNQIKLYEFDWKPEARENAPHWNIGMVADELETLDNNFTFGGGNFDDGTINAKGVDSFYLLGYVVGAIQELSKKYEDLKEKIKNNE